MNSLALKGRALSDKKMKQLAAEAEELDTEIRQAVAGAKASLLQLGAFIARMRESCLWMYLVDDQGKPKYRTMQEYVVRTIGPIANGKYFEIVAAYSLTQGENPITGDAVEKLGIKKAAELARLKPAQRTPELVKRVTNSTVADAKCLIQETINQVVPESERRTPLQLLNRSLLPQTITLIEEVEQDGQYIEGIRDSDKSVPLRVKLWHAVWVFFREAHETDLKEAREYRTTLDRTGEID